MFNLLAGRDVILHPVLKRPVSGRTDRPTLIGNMRFTCSKLLQRRRIEKPAAKSERVWQNLGSSPLKYRPSNLNGSKSCLNFPDGPTAYAKLK